MDETRWFINSSVGVCVTLGIVASIVEVRITIGGVLVGRAVDVDSITGTSVAVQAVRRTRRIAMGLFIEGNYMSLRETRWLSSPMFLGAYRSHQG
jgi:hypothetical protein